MRTVCLVLRTAWGSVLHSQAALQIENAALRHQRAVLQRQARGRPPRWTIDRLCWVWLCRVWPGWRHAQDPCLNALRGRRRLSLEAAPARPGRAVDSGYGLTCLRVIRRALVPRT